MEGAGWHFGECGQTLELICNRFIQKGVGSKDPISFLAEFTALIMKRICCGVTSTVSKQIL